MCVPMKCLKCDCKNCCGNFMLLLWNNQLNHREVKVLEGFGNFYIQKSFWLPLKHSTPHCMCMNFFLAPFKIRSIFHLRVKMTWIAAKIITGAWMCQLADKWRVFAQAPPPPLLDAYAHWGPSFKLGSILSVVLDFGVPSERGLLSHAQLQVPSLGLVKVFGTGDFSTVPPKWTNFRIWSKVFQLKHAPLSSSFRTEFSFACGWSSKKNFSQLVFRRFTFLQLKIYGRFSIHKYFFHSRLIASMRWYWQGSYCDHVCAESLETHLRSGLLGWVNFFRNEITAIMKCELKVCD